LASGCPSRQALADATMLKLGHLLREEIYLRVKANDEHRKKERGLQTLFPI
jgi:hypothetical protein